MNAEFTAKLENIELDDAAKHRIAVGLQNLIVQELAHIDKKGDLVITRPIKLRPILNGIVAVEQNGVINIKQLS